MHSLHLLSLLLQYPTLDLQAVAPEIGLRLAADPALPADKVAALAPLLNRLANDDIYDLQEAYVGLFDRGRAVSLHLFEHVHGESRDRGQAMVDLRERYLAAGLEPEGNELPDYLPLFLDYCSVLPHEAAIEALAEPGVVLAALAGRLADRGADHAAVLDLLCAIAGVTDVAEAQAAAPPPEDPEDLEALDAAWAEEEIRFGTDAAPDPNAACPKASAMVDRLRAALDSSGPQPAERTHRHG
jgi:nitrate reductase delta subunit